MSIEVKSIDTNQAKAALKECPKEVRDYVRALENVYNINKHNCNLAIGELRKYAQENTKLKEALKDWINESPVILNQRYDGEEREFLIKQSDLEELKALTQEKGEEK